MSRYQGGQPSRSLEADQDNVRREASSSSSPAPVEKHGVPEFNPGWRFYVVFTTMAVITLAVALDATSLSVALPVSQIVRCATSPRRADCPRRLADHRQRAEGDSNRGLLVWHLIPPDLHRLPATVRLAQPHLWPQTLDHARPRLLHCGRDHCRRRQ